VKVVVKLGGTLLDERSSRVQIARQLAEVPTNLQLTVVHGGGKQVTRFLDGQGVTSRFVNGLRVSDEAVVDAVTKVIAGSVNKQLVAALIAAGRPSVGLSGVDGSLAVAEQLSPELGFVGKPVGTNARLLDVLVAAGFTPVVACIAGDAYGNIYNVNADGMAVACAAGWQADKLLFLTDVPGVKDANGSVIPTLNSSEATQLIESGIAVGGMQAKLEACLSALRYGLSEVVIASGREPDVCGRLLAGQIAGTRLHA
jgi:acetylglutamate kinase